MYTFSSSVPSDFESMKLLAFTSVFIAAGALASSLVAALPQIRTGTTSMGYDSTFGDASGDISTVACSDGSNGLATKGYKTFGSIPSFPSIGGIPAISGWNSASCGSCWQITYGNNTIYLTGIDAGKGSFVSSEAAVNTLTDGNAEQYGRIDVNAIEVGASNCGL